MDTADQNPVVAVAAEEREFLGLLRHARHSEPLPWGLDYARSAEIGGQSWILVANGPGPELAAAAAERATRDLRPKAVISTGFCGGLDRGLVVGDVFVADEVQGGGGRWQALAAPAGRRHARGGLVSQDRVAVSVEEKAELARSGARAVEMEAAAVARQAERCESPFYCVRVISDGAGERMPLDFNRFRRRDGRFSKSRIALAAMLRPSVWQPLMKFNQRCQMAAEHLGDFLADCRF